MDELSTSGRTQTRAGRCCVGKVESQVLSRKAQIGTGHSVKTTRRCSTSSRNNRTSDCTRPFIFVGKEEKEVRNLKDERKRGGSAKSVERNKVAQS